jgi:hypothetical protein
MPSQSESSFGARLRKGQDILQFITNFPGYAPPRPEESITGFDTFLVQISDNNTTETQAQQDYSQNVTLRQKAFLKEDGSVDKLLSPIKGAVEAQYGKNSKEAELISAIIKNMRNTKLIKPPIDPTATTAPTAISQSERSYGSLTQYFKDIINTLTQFNSYNPSNPQLTITGLKATATQLDTLNNTVAQKYQALKVARDKRRDIYTELKDRIQRIKSYVKAQYGNNSTEYRTIKSINI